MDAQGILSTPFFSADVFQWAQLHNVFDILGKTALNNRTHVIIRNVRVFFNGMLELALIALHYCTWL